MAFDDRVQQRNEKYKKFRDNSIYISGMLAISQLP